MRGVEKRAGFKRLATASAHTENASMTALASDKDLYSGAGRPVRPRKLAEAERFAQESDPHLLGGSFGAWCLRKLTYKASRGVFALGFWRAALSVRDVMAWSAGNSSLEDILSILACARRQIAREGGALSQRFGVRAAAGTRLTTGCALYWQVPGVRQFFADLRQGRALPGLELALPGSKQPRDCIRQRACIRATTFAGHTVRLTGYSETSLPFPFSLGVPNWVWEHGVCTPEVFAQLEHLFQRAQAPLPEGSPAQRFAALCPKVAELHWWLSHACLYHRGSAAITDMLSAALFEYDGLHRGVWRAMPDVVALVTPSVNVFCQAYAGLLR